MINCTVAKKPPFPLTKYKKMRQYLLIPALLSIFLSYSNLNAEEATRLESETDRISYSLGYQLGNDLKRQGLDLDADALVFGFNNASVGAEPALDRKEMDTILRDLKGKIELAPVVNAGPFEVVVKAKTVTI